MSDYHSNHLREDFRYDSQTDELWKQYITLVDEQEKEEVRNKLIAIWGDKDSQLPVMRGGSWNTNRDWVRCAARNRNYPSVRLNGIGFRCSRAVL